MTLIKYALHFNKNTLSYNDPLFKLQLHNRIEMS